MLFGANRLAAEEKDTLNLGESVVTSFRVDRKLKELPAPLVVTGAADILKKSELSLSHVLNYEPGVFMGGDGVWSTNVYVRGLGEQRLVILVDGNRVETATDLTASLSMIDVNDVERVEIIKGAQSVLYGTGAMGGIINVITKNGRFADKPYVNGNLISSFSSVNRYFSEHADVNAGGRKWYLYLGGSYGKAGNIMTPQGEIANSQFTTDNIDAKLGFKPLEGHVLKVQFQRNWSKDVGIPGGSAFPGPATARYEDIGRTLFDASYEITGISNALASIKLKYYHQDIERNVVMNPNTTTSATLAGGNIQVTHPNVFRPNASHVTNGAQFQTNWQLGENSSLIAGADFMRRDMVSKRTKDITMYVNKPDGTNIRTNQLMRYETPVPASSFTNTGIFVQDETRLMDGRLTLMAGVRADLTFVANEKNYDVDSVYLNGAPNPAVVQRVTFEANKTRDPSWSANAGALYKLGKKTDLTLNVARSYRAPSLEERFKYIDLGNLVQLGNADLKPENGYSGDIGLRHWGDMFTLQSSVFANRLTNMIAEERGEFKYNTAAAPDTYVTVPALVYGNIGKALLYGADFSAGYMPLSCLLFTLTGSYVNGRDTENGTPLPLIPPVNGSLSVTYHYPKLGNASLTLFGAGRKDASNLAEGEDATDAYLRLDFAVNTRVFQLGKVCGLQFFAGVDNITDASYTNFLSTNRGSISIEPGRNFFVRALISF